MLVALVAAWIALRPGRGRRRWLAATLGIVAGLELALALALHCRVYDRAPRDGGADRPARAALRHPRHDGGAVRSRHAARWRSTRRSAGRRRPASAEIARLRRLVALLESRKNVLFAIPAAAIAWTTQIGCAIDAWRARVGPHVVAWIDAVGEFEALCAMATYAAERPDHVFPEFVATRATLEADRLAHPLLPVGAVGNSITIGGPAAHLFIVSGSNMSGKSTFLRALGAQRRARPDGVAGAGRGLSAVPARRGRHDPRARFAAGGPLAVLRRDSPPRPHRRARASPPGRGPVSPR